MTMLAPKTQRRPFCGLVCFRILFGCALLTQGAGLAHAQHSEQPNQRARPIFEAGRNAYEEGRYSEAAEAFERVFAMTGHPFMLRNLGNAYLKLGERERAAAALHQYLRLLPDASDRAEVEILIASVESRAVAAEPEPELAPLPEKSTLTVAPQPARGLFAGRTFTWVALGASAALGGVATVLWLDAHGDYAKLAAGCGAHGGCAESQLTSVSHGVTAANVTLGFSLAALASAVALYFVEGGASAAPAEHVTLLPSAGPSGVSLSVQGRL